MNDFREQVKAKLLQYRPQKVDAPDRIPAAVLIPFFEKEGEIHLLFTKRTDQLQHHSGEICFPGGMKETYDQDSLATALREVHEEIAVPAPNVEILGTLDELKTVVSNFLVVPYVGYISNGTQFVPNKAEVEMLLEIPFRHFRDASIFHQETRIVDHQPYPVYYYQWKNHTIWGVTGRILKSLLDLLF
jgi:8-oxo-dGTP pyrophosphatase MutT (NUDIX family)